MLCHDGKASARKDSSEANTEETRKAALEIHRQYLDGVFLKRTEGLGLALVTNAPAERNLSAVG